jgi:NADPH-dependent 7-cyano-7-deazaguanine reductase QueF-like protein
MKTIKEVREILTKIQGAIYEIDPDESGRGTEKGIATLWDGIGLIERKGLYEVEPIDKFDRNDELLENAQNIEEIFEYGSEIDENNLVEAMGSEESDKIRKSVLVRGTDGLAWYASFHWKGVQWGIYIPISSVMYMVSDVFNNLNTDFWTKFKIGFRALHQHELFHFATDYICSQWEVITGKPCHRPAKKELKDLDLNYNLMEEMLANSHMIRSFWGGKASLKTGGRAKALRDFVKLQPPGYNSGGECVSDRKFADYCEWLARTYVECIKGYDSQYLDALDINSLYPFYPKIDWRYCPVHILHDEGRFQIPLIELDLFRQVTNIIETKAFSKALQRLPSNIQRSWEKVKKILASTTAARGLDFKFWKRTSRSSIYSVRVSKDYRAHLERQRAKESWLAIAIGTHKEMGHG